ncbi:MAG TPA: peptidoglycan DD-metalloendopeptidase family protein [Mycobacteriales bacterium]
MTRGRVIAAVAGGCVVALAVLGAGVGATVLMLFGGAASLTGGEGDCGYALPGGDVVPSSVGTWSAGQVALAGTLVGVGRAMGVPPRGWVVAVAAAMQESGLRNPAGGDRDSRGVLQQRPSMGWGTAAQLADPAYQARNFYTRLLRIGGWEAMRLTDAAQLVQRSATPEAYQRWEADAGAVVAAISGVSSVDVVGAGYPAAPCGPAILSVLVPPGTWTRPADGPIGSGFRTPDRPHHDGVDILAPRFAPVRAAAAGRVVTVECNASSGTCDRDGGMSVQGCGWYVEILHAGNVVTRYCHLVRRPEVSVGEEVQGGQVLGFVGSSGNSSGPHLHFEVHVGGTVATSANAVDPARFLAAAGIRLAGG